MALKNRQLANPNAKPDEVNPIGVSNTFIRNEADQQEITKLQEILKNKSSLSKDNDFTKDEIYAKSMPKISREEIIDRSLIDTAPDEWNFFGRPDAQTLDMIINSIYTDGLLNPITVWEQENGRYMILAGHTREFCYDKLYQATKEEKYASIPCKVYKYSDLTLADAKRIIIISNIAQRAKEDIKLRIKSIGELARLEKEKASYGDGLDIGSIVAEITGTSRTSVFFYKKLNNLIDPLLDMFVEGKLTRRAADVICSMPEKMQEHFYQKEYYKSINAKIVRNLWKIETIEEMDALFDPEKKREISHSYKITVNYEKPKNSKVVPIFISRKETSVFIDALYKMVNSNTDISEETKNSILEQLKSL